LPPQANWRSQSSSTNNMYVMKAQVRSLRISPSRNASTNEPHSRARARIPDPGCPSPTRAGRACVAVDRQCFDDVLRKTVLESYLASLGEDPGEGVLGPLGQAALPLLKARQGHQAALSNCLPDPCGCTGSACAWKGNLPGMVRFRTQNGGSFQVFLDDRQLRGRLVPRRATSIYQRPRWTCWVSVESIAVPSITRAFEPLEFPPWDSC
jgi:hypothetical protein